MQGKIFYKDAHNLINNGEKENIIFCLSKVDLHAWISGHKQMEWSSQSIKVLSLCLTVDMIFIL